MEKLGGHWVDRDVDVVLSSLVGKLALGSVAVAFAFAILLVRVLDSDLAVHQELAVHLRDGVVRRLESGEADEAVALAEVVLVACHLGRADEGTEAGEGFVEHFFVHQRVQVANEELGADLDRLLLVGARLVDSDGLSIQSDLVHDFCCVVCVLFAYKLDEAVALMGL